MFILPKPRRKTLRLDGIYREKPIVSVSFEEPFAQYICQNIPTNYLNAFAMTYYAVNYPYENANATEAKE
jgi:hypothetical protein